MTDNSSMFLDYQRWLEARGLLLLPIDANPDDTLQIPQQFRAPEVEPDDAPVTPAEPETLEPED